MKCFTATSNAAAVLAPRSAAELVAAQRLEAAERRKMEEKERRLKQVETCHGLMLGTTNSATADIGMTAPASEAFRRYAVKSPNLQLLRAQLDFQQTLLSVPHCWQHCK